MPTLAVLFNLEDFFQLLFSAIGTATYIVFPAGILFFGALTLTSFFRDGPVGERMVLFSDFLTRMCICVVCERVYLEMNANFLAQDLMKDMDGELIVWPHTHAAWLASFFFALLIAGFFLVMYWFVTNMIRSLNPIIVPVFALLFAGCTFGWIGLK